MRAKPLDSRVGQQDRAQVVRAIGASGLEVDPPASVAEVDDARVTQRVAGVGDCATGPAPVARKTPSASTPAIPVRSYQFSSALARPSYSASGSAPPTTAVTRVPRESQEPARGLRTVGPRDQVRPSSLSATLVVIRSSAPASASGWQQTHIRHRPSTTWTTGSFAAVSPSPRRTVTARASGSDSTVSESRASIHQSFEPGEAQLTYSRQPPPGRGTRAGRSSDAEPNFSRERAPTVSNDTPSSDLASTTAMPRPSSSGWRTR
jgi:hypothetical protein